MKAHSSSWLFLCLAAALLVPAAGICEADRGHGGLLDGFTAEVHGYYELRGGCRTGRDPHEEDMSIMETRLQVDLPVSGKWFDLKYKEDLWADGITEEVGHDTRELWLFSRPAGFLDIKVGRQVLTWGTGDLVFLNDLFPKDWRSFFIGRDAEYLKAPSDAVKLGFFTDTANLDLVYTPRFDPDRFITGEYVSYWNGQLGRLGGRDAIVHARQPDRWFDDDEIALRLYGNVKGYELALYGYRGYWKTPEGQTPSGTPVFPRLNACGFSVRGRTGPGIANIEIAYYRSVDDPRGEDPLVRNSEVRYLAGYAQEIGPDLNGSLQYYVEQMLDWGDYERGLTGAEGKDRLRHVITLQLTQLAMDQNLRLSLSAYYSPSDRDAYVRPNIHYMYTDNIRLELGANIFFGEDPATFFAQFEKNTNIYAALRYSF
ncbi:MAG: hypothetical protein GXX82_05045 [Syntrophorhabdus sp.]|nr:hypothetical protein [Syntrophorhabdus sp.]